MNLARSDTTKPGGWRTPAWGAFAVGVTGLGYAVFAGVLLYFAQGIASHRLREPEDRTFLMELISVAVAVALMAVALLGQTVANLLAASAARSKARSSAGARRLASGSAWLLGVLTVAMVVLSVYQALLLQRLSLWFMAVFATVLPLVFSRLTLRTVANAGGNTN